MQINVVGSNNIAAGSMMLSAVILSLNETRYNSAAALVKSLGILNVRRKVPIKRNDSRISSRISPPDTARRRGYLSNYLSFSDTWKEFGAESGDPNDWQVFLEDDVVLPGNMTSSKILDAIFYGMQLAEMDGFLRFGVCGPRVKKQFGTVEREGVVYTRVAGRCSHAYALARWRAEGFEDMLESSRANMPHYLKDQFEVVLDVKFHRVRKIICYHIYKHVCN